MDVYRIPVPGASGVAFGGPNRDILFVLTQRSIYNGVSNQFVEEILDNSSLYMITGLGVTGMPYSGCWNLKGEHKVRY